MCASHDCAWEPIMSAEPLELHQLIDEIRQVRAGLDRGDVKTNGRIDQIEKSVNELFKKVSRPGFSAERDDDDLAARFPRRDRARPW